MNRGEKTITISRNAAIVGTIVYLSILVTALIFAI